VSDGEFGDNSGSHADKSAIFKAPFELSIISKADVDAAISSLGIPGYWGKWCRDPEQSPVGYNLTPAQYNIAEYIRGNGNHIKGLARALAKLA